MSRIRTPENTEDGWRSLVKAAGAASGVVVLLGLIVGAIWLAAGPNADAPANGLASPPTPTPRSLAFPRETLIPDAVPEAPGADVGADLPPADPAPAAATVPALLSSAENGGTAGSAGGVLFSAPDVEPFAAIASGSWQASQDVLRNVGSHADAEPLLTLQSMPPSPFAIEAEIKVEGVIDAFCGQSFGIAGGTPAPGRAYGGGVYFPCTEESDRARLTDVSSWQDGYHADPLIAESAFSPGSDWRTYRFEIRGDKVRLLVDGVGIVSGTLDAPLESLTAFDAGIWSQGVALEIRSIKIFQLPDE